MQVAWGQEWVEDFHDEVGFVNCGLNRSVCRRTSQDICYITMHCDFPRVGYNMLWIS